MSRRDRRLILSSFGEGDAPALAELDRDPEHRRRFDFPPEFAPSLQHSQEVITRWHAERRAGIRFAFAVRDADTGELLGGCELTPIRAGTVNVSYWTLPAHRGGGIAAEALRQVCALAFADLEVQRVEAVIDPENVPSRRVATRNGFAEQGERDGRVVYLRERGA